MPSETSRKTIDCACVNAALSETRRLFRGSPAATDALDEFQQELETAINAQAGRSQSDKTAVMICKMSVEIDTSQMDAALAKAEELKQALAQLSSVPASVAVTS